MCGSILGISAFAMSSRGRCRTCSSVLLTGTFTGYLVERLRVGQRPIGYRIADHHVADRHDHDFISRRGGQCRHARPPVPEVAPGAVTFAKSDKWWERTNAGAFGPNALDGTFGPEAVFVNAPPVANTSPAQGFQHFGEVEIDGKSGAFTVNLRDREGRSLWSTTLKAPR